MGFGKGKTESVNKVQPWVPTDGSFLRFQQRAEKLVGPETIRANQGAADAIRRLDKRTSGFGPGVKANLERGSAGVAPDMARALNIASGKAGFSDPRRAGFDAIRAGATDAIFDEATTSAQTPGYADGFLGAMDRFANPDAEGSARAALRSNVLAEVMPAINSTFAGSGMTGSGLHQQLLAKGVASGLADVESEYERRGMEAAQAKQNAFEGNRAFGMDAALARQAAAENDARLGMEGEIALMGNDERAADRILGVSAGDADRALGAASLGSSLLSDRTGRDLGLINATRDARAGTETQASNNFFNLMNAAVGGASSTSSQTDSPGLLEILGTGAGIFSLFSDERLKEDKKRVGKMDDGTPIYTYRYKDGAPDPTGGKTMMGVMAQDLKGKKKKAVSQGLGDFLMVDYGEL